MNKILTLISSIRRRLIWLFKPRYIIEQIKKRKGSCEGCGAICCTQTRKCPLVKDGKCKIYKSSIPFFCWVFPIDEEDIKLAGVKEVCQFYWPKPKEKIYKVK